MTAHALPQSKRRRKPRGVWLSLAFILGFGAVAAGLITFISYVLWPSWPAKPVARDAPAVPITVAGVLFEVPPAAIRAAMQRQPGAHDRIDLVFLWPSLKPPAAVGEAAASAVDMRNNAGRAPRTADRIFVTIADLGNVLAPAERLRSIYPRYFAALATAGPDGLAVLPFRAGTPYDGEDLIYVAENPEQFFARCTRPAGTVPGTCIHERSMEAAEITLRFPREWLQHWRTVAAGFDRLVALLHPANESRRQKANDR